MQAANSTYPGAPADLRLPEVRKVLKGDFETVDFHMVESMLPMIVFLLANWLGPAPLAIGASFLASLLVFVRNRDHGVVRAMAIMAFVVTGGAAIVGLAANSAKVFAAQNIAGDFVLASVCVGSVLTGRPLVGAVARDVIPALKSLIELPHALFAVLTLGLAGTQIFSGIVRMFLLEGLSTNEYVIISRLIGLPLSIIFYAVCFFAIRRLANSRLLERTPPPVPMLLAPAPIERAA